MAADSGEASARAGIWCRLLKKENPGADLIAVRLDSRKPCGLPITRRSPSPDVSLSPHYFARDDDADDDPPQCLRVLRQYARRGRPPPVVATQTTGAINRAWLLQRVRRPIAIPMRKANSSEPSGASRATLARTLSGIPGCRPASIAACARRTAAFNASNASVAPDLGWGTGSRPS